MPTFQIAIEKPDEIIPRLRTPEQWKKGRSAFELSTAWMRARGLPTRVREVLEQAAEWRGAELREGVFERETELPGRGGPSQTDLLGIVALKDGNAILGVEGKVDEPFGELVSEWRKGSPSEVPNEDPATTARRERSRKNRQHRLDGLCDLLSVDAVGMDSFYYQLIHRTCAAIYEAKRFGYGRAVMLVHSFAERPASPPMSANFRNFVAFSAALQMPIDNPNSISEPRTCAGVQLRLAWATDTASG